MHFRLVLLLAFSSSLAMATPKDVTAMMKDSASTREAAALEKDSAKKIKKLKDYEARLNATIKEYEKASPDKGGDAEGEVVKFSIRMEPVFELAGKNLSKADCEKTKGRLALDDRGNRGEEAKLTPAAEEAIRWIDLICK